MDKRKAKIVFATLVGGLAGFLYYTWIGCYNDSCLIGSNLWISIVYGAALGGSLGWGKKNKQLSAND